MARLRFWSRKPRTACNMSLPDGEVALLSSCKSLLWTIGLVDLNGPLRSWAIGKLWLLWGYCGTPHNIMPRAVVAHF